MGLREDSLAVLNGKPYEKFPIVHFGFWEETAAKWYQEGHVPREFSENVYDGTPADEYIGKALGFDYNWSTVAGGNGALMPPFEPRVIETLPNGQIKSVDSNGAIILTKPNVVSIPSEVGHLLEDRASWEEHFLPRLQMSEDRINKHHLQKLQQTEGRSHPLGLHCGSLFGTIRNWLGLEGTAYLLIDDEDLFTEIIDTHAGLQLNVVRTLLERGAKPDYAHFWEDIACKSGPLISPDVFAEKVGPWYKKFTDLLSEYGVNIVSLDCDGVIDKLIPIWFENGVNTMFPIEVGVWDASIEPWRKQYGPQLRGVGGMNKNVFARDFAAVDEEVERLVRLVELGGYIPCPDHRIPPTAKWENVQYYTERLR